MSTNNFFRSDLQNIYNITQSSALVYPKELIIDILRDFFSKDAMYHYVRDEYGFAKTVDNTDLPISAGISDDVTTRLYIGQNYRHDGIFYPALLVKTNGARYVPLSATREKGAIEYKGILYEDSFGHKKTVYVPESFLFAGIWEGSITIDILTRSLRARDDLAELVALCFADINFDTMRLAGVVVKPPVIGPPSESEDRNDKLFRQSVTMDIRTEWRRNIPVLSVIDRILFSVEIDSMYSDRPTDPSFDIITEINLAETLVNI